MRATTFFSLKFLINFTFVALAIILPLVICKTYEYEIDGVLESVQVWLIVDGLLLVLQTIVNCFLKTIPVIPPMLTPPKENRKDE